MIQDPVIPSGLYMDFVAVLQRSLPLSTSISTYRTLIDLLPPTSRYLLLYLLDLLSVFAQSSAKNLMTASNLATVFQPGLVSTRNMKEGSLVDDKNALLGFPGFVDGKLPGTIRGTVVLGGRGTELEGEVKDSAKGKEVLEFLIENQKSFVLGLERPVNNNVDDITNTANVADIEVTSQAVSGKQLEMKEIRKEKGLELSGVES